MYNDMPHGVDPDSFLPISSGGGGGGGFIPPPPGAVHGGQPADNYNPYPGANQSSHWPPSWSAGAAQAPTWLHQQQLQQQQQQQQYPPLSSQSWSYGQQYPTNTPYPPWNAPTPAGSWGDATPALSWGPPTPASANVYPTGSPWVQQQGYLSNPAQESSTGQPITASPWFNGGGGPGPAYPAYGTSASGGALVKKKSKRRSLNQQYSLPHSPYSQPDLSLALHRSQSHEAPAFQRSASYGGNGTLYPYSAYNQQQHGEEYNARNLARRPRDWRPDYNPRDGIASYIPRVIRNRSDVTEWNDPVKRSPHEYLAYKPTNPPIYLDLRTNPFDRATSSLEFLHLQRPHNDLDLAQLATQPAAQGMRLFHPLLPWYVDVVQTHPNGITVYDVLWQMFAQMDMPIQGRHWFNEDLDDGARGRMAVQFQERTEGDEVEMRKGVKRVDFLKGRVVFEGLARGKNGLWEIKTRKPEKM